MVTPRKRRNDGNRSEKRANQRYTPPAEASYEPAARESIPRPPGSCAPYHFYWCDGHNDWHHHDEFVVTAIERTLQQQQQQPPSSN